MHDSGDVYEIILETWVFVTQIEADTFNLFSYLHLSGNARVNEN